MIVRATLAMTLLMFAAVVHGNSERVKFDGMNFTMTCPHGSTEWYRNNYKLDKTEQTLTLAYRSDTKGFYSCKTSSESYYYFYVKGKVCERCIEVDAVWVLVALTVDVTATILLMVIIYKCTKRKQTAGPAAEPRAAAAARPGGRAPPTQSPYESLNPHTRSQDPYSFVSRTG